VLAARGRALLASAGRCGAGSHRPCLFRSRVSLKELRSSAGECSETVARRVAAARAIQYERCGRPNASLNTAAVSLHCRLDAAGRALSDRAAERLGFSARFLHHVLKVARTVADLAGSDSIRPAHRQKQSSTAFRQAHPHVDRIGAVLQAAPISRLPQDRPSAAAPSTD
jgi:magnesium chelatase subunit ChlI-like protein